MSQQRAEKDLSLPAPRFVIPSLTGNPESDEKASWEYWIPAFAGMTLAARMTQNVMPDLIGHPEGNEKTSWEYWIRYRGSSLRFVSRFRGKDKSNQGMKTDRYGSRTESYR